MNVRSLIPSAVIAVFSVAVILVAMQLEESPPMIVGDSMQPRAFPIFLMVLNLILVGILVVQTVRNPPKPVPLEGFATWGSIALLPLFYLLTVEVDLFIAIALVMFALCLLWGERRLLVAAVVSLVTPIFIFFLFDLVLKVRFPRGLFTNWYYG